MFLVKSSSVCHKINVAFFFCTTENSSKIKVPSWACANQIISWNTSPEWSSSTYSRLQRWAHRTCRVLLSLRRVESYLLASTGSLAQAAQFQREILARMFWDFHSFEMLILGNTQNHGIMKMGCKMIKVVPHLISRPVKVCSALSSHRCL